MNPLRAIRFDDYEKFRAAKLPGSFFITETAETRWFWICCPSGNGDFDRLCVGDKFKPGTSPSWSWDGSLDNPTLHPSVNRQGVWHGWLKGGYWQLAGQPQNAETA